LDLVFQKYNQWFDHLCGLMLNESINKTNIGLKILETTT